MLLMRRVGDEVSMMGILGIAIYKPVQEML